MIEKKEPTISDYIEVRESEIHGTGIFAAMDIPKGAKVIEYVGARVTKKQAEKIADAQFEKGESGCEGHVYLFELNSRYDINGNVEWNTAKWINHSCDPNCETENDDDEIWIVALRDIKKGEELSYNYGYEFENYDEHLCRCGTPNCVGYIIKEEDRGRLRNSLRMKAMWRKVKES